MTVIARFEHEFAAWLGVRGAVATGFGRGALWLALEAAAVRGSDVLVPEFICPHVTGAVERAGARPVFYRVRGDLTISPDDLRAAWTPKTRAVILPHYFGHATPAIRELVDECHARGVVAIEDCALAMGARRDGELCGRFGDFAAFSLSKSDWCFGGGVVTAKDEARLGELRRLQREKLRPARWLCFFYGLLKWADYTANRPRWSRVAAGIGRALQAISGIRESNFYDAGKFDAEMTWVCSLRAGWLLRHLQESIAERTAIVQKMWRTSQERLNVRALQGFSSGCAPAYLVLTAGEDAARLRDEAEQEGISLRPIWPALCDSPRKDTGVSSWDDLLLLEIPRNLGVRGVSAVLSFLEWHSA